MHCCASFARWTAHYVEVSEAVYTDDQFCLICAASAYMYIESFRQKHKKGKEMRLETSARSASTCTSTHVSRIMLCDENGKSHRLCFASENLTNFVMRAGERSFVREC